MKKTACIISLTLCFAGCKKKCPNTPQVKETYPIQVNLPLHYKPNDTLRYLRNKTDTVTYYSQGLQQGYNYTINSAGSDCPLQDNLAYSTLNFLDGSKAHSIFLNEYVNSAYFETFEVDI